MQAREAMAAPRHVYRLIEGAQPARNDFLSDKARNKALRNRSAEMVRRHEGFSAWRSEASARALARRFPRLGTHIAELKVPPGTEVWPFGQNPDHVTVFGDADALLRSVVRIAALE